MRKKLDGDRQVGQVTLGGSKATKEQRSGFEVVRDCFTEGGDSVVGVFCLELLRASGGFRGGSKVSTEPPFLAKSTESKLDCYTKATVLYRQVLDFMEPSLPSSYKKILALAHLRVILNEY